MDKIELKGEIFSGMSRGSEWIKYFRYRLLGLLGFTPYEGTLNVRLERPIDAEEFETKRLEHVRVGGQKKVDARFFSLEIIAGDKKEKCFGMQMVYHEQSSYGKDVIEVFSEKNLREELGLKDGSHVKLILEKNKK